MARLIRVLLIVLVVVDCGEHDYSDRTTATRLVRAEECPCSGGPCEATGTPELVLREVQTIPVMRSTPLAQLIAHDSAIVFAIDGQTGRVQVLSIANREATMTVADSALRTLGWGPNRIWAATDSKLYQIDVGTWTIVELGLTLGVDERIISVAENDSTLWIETLTDTTAKLLIYPSIDRGHLGRLQPLGHVALPGPARIHPDHSGRLVLSLVNSPYTILLVDSSGDQVGSLQPPLASMLSAPNSGTGAVFALAAIPLDCGFILQVLADLQSDHRWFVLYDWNARRTIRIKLITEALGLVQSLGAMRLLIGLRDVGERREVVLFKWAWD